jgi:hypothetical protein
MATIDAQTDVTAEQTEQTGQSGQTEAKCPVCPHARDAHDVISTRYCDATVANGFSRGCVCGS